jgi:hypothetical protein
MAIACFGEILEIRNHSMCPTSESPGLTLSRRHGSLRNNTRHVSIDLFVWSNLLQMDTEYGIQISVGWITKVVVLRCFLQTFKLT